MRDLVNGEQFAQVANPDPFAAPAWRSPVYRTPAWIVAVIQIVRLTGRLLRFLARHPIADTITACLIVTWAYTAWPGLAGLAGGSAVLLAVWRWRWPASFAWWVTMPALGCWRAWHYRRRWHAVMTIGRLAVLYQGRVLLPVLGKVRSTGYTDRVAVVLVSGQSPADLASRADNLAHGFGAILCRVRSARPGAVVLELVRRDALAAIIPALPVGSHCDLRALPVGRREDGQPWTIRLHATHLLIAGATGAGKASLLWGLVRALLPALRDGTARVLAADPKLMELAYGRAIFDRYGSYAAEPEQIVSILERAVAEMQARAGQFAGRHRSHDATSEHPFTVIFVDEVAFLTAYHPDKALRERVKAALATLTTQGRAVGYAVVAALQDPRKEVMPIRNLFPDRIAMRLDEPEQVDMVLGDGTRDRGALADQISTDEAAGAGVAYVRLADDPDPVRVRAAWVSDPDIRAMCDQYAAPVPAEHEPELVAIGGGS
jgi:S-DNA-T family DNA segregation ATPase FtsK/SpoIIIE